MLGDLHGCYSCLKAAVLQSNFIERAWAHQWDPQRYGDKIQHSGEVNTVVVREIHVPKPEAVS